MGNQAQYRRIITELFIDCKDPWEITYEDYNENGKKITKRLAPRPMSTATHKSTGDIHADAQALLARLGKGVQVNTRAFVESVNAAKEAAEVASPPSG